MPESGEANLTDTLEHLAAVVGRRRWWILLTAAGTIAATFLVLSRLPNRYTSEATLLVVQQQVPQRYVVPTTTTDIREALQATTQEVLSRTRLHAIIDEFNLYSAERNSVSPERLLELIRRDIKIEPIENHMEGRDVNAFKISFIANTPQRAQAVTTRLTSLFIQQNLQTREHQATTTTDFLHEQLESAKQKLTDAEEQLGKFKMQSLGELPEQQAGNLAILGGLQSQLQNTTASISRAEEQREYLGSLIENRALTLGNELAHLKTERAKLLELYTPEYPAVVKLNDRMAQVQSTLDKLQVSLSGRADTAPSTVSAPSSILAEEDISMSQVRSQLEANRLEIENLNKDKKRLRAAIEQYQNRLNATPVREQQLASFLRNYELLKREYADLLSKEMQAQLAADLEKRQEGQQFRLVDRPSLPAVPSSPARIKIMLGGTLAGIVLGAVLAFLLDFAKGCFYSEEDIIASFAAPLVVGIPVLRTPDEERSRARRRAFEWVAASAVALVVFAAEVYEFYLYRHG